MKRDGRTDVLRDATARVDGFTLRYRIGGSGPVLLMLHGFTLTGEQWVPFAAELTDRHTVVAADLPGHGGSSPMPGPFRFARAAELMHGLLDQLDVERARGIGHSGRASSRARIASSSWTTPGGSSTGGFIRAERRRRRRSTASSTVSPGARSACRRKRWPP